MYYMKTLYFWSHTSYLTSKDDNQIYPSIYLSLQVNTKSRKKLKIRLSRESGEIWQHNLSILWTCHCNISGNISPWISRPHWTDDRRLNDQERGRLCKKRETSNPFSNLSFRRRGKQFSTTKSEAYFKSLNRNGWYIIVFHFKTELWHTLIYFPKVNIDLYNMNITFVTSAGPSALTSKSCKAFSGSSSRKYVSAHVC